MPLASVDEWRARIGSSWCALGRPIKSRPRNRGCFGSPLTGCRKRIKLQDDSVLLVIVFVLMVVAMLTLWNLILDGYSPVCTSIMVCSSLDVVLMQCVLCMSLLSSYISQPLSSILSSFHHELKSTSGTKLEDFPYPIRNDQNISVLTLSSDMNEKMDVKWNLFRPRSHFWHRQMEKVITIKKCLTSALVRCSQLLCCGDVEENPGPYDHDDNDARGFRVTEKHLPKLLCQLREAASSWQKIGVYIGLDSGELDNIKASPSLYADAPFSWLTAMLVKWMQLTPGNSHGGTNVATLEHLKAAISDAGFEEVAHRLIVIEPVNTHNFTSSSGVRLTEKHVPTLLDQLKSVARVWRRIGMHLGFTQRELDNIQTRPSLLFEAPCSWLVSMLEEWIQSAQGDKYGSTNFATLEHLKAALHDAGLEVLAYKVNVVVPGNTSDMARSIGVQLNEEHLPTLLDQLRSQATRWRRIGAYLGFSQGKLDNIQARPSLLSGAPVSLLESMIKEWMQLTSGDSRGRATLNDLKIALSKAGLGAAAHSLSITVPHHTPSSSGVQLTDKHLTTLYNQLYPDAVCKWKEIGTFLGFSRDEIHNIEANPLLFSNRFYSYLQAMLSEWIQFAPGDSRGSTNFATLEHLQAATNYAGLAIVADRLNTVIPGNIQSVANSSGVRLSEEDLPTLLDQLKSVAAKWRRIGVCLGFSLGEVENIQTRPTLLSDAPLSWLTAMLEEWMKWVPGDRRGSKNFATLDDLKNALTNAELAKIAYELDVYNPDKAPIFASSTGVQLNEEHLPTLLDQLRSQATRWRRIGAYLGFSQRKLDNIQARPSLLSGAPASLLESMIKEWMQLTSGDSRGRATLNDLKVALSKAGLRAAAHSLSITVPHHTPSSRGVQLTEKHLSSLCDQLNNYSYRWTDIGMFLEVSYGEIENIEANPMLFADAPYSSLRSVLETWIQSAPRDSYGSTKFATLEDLKTALENVGFALVACSLNVINPDNPPELETESALSKEDLMKLELALTEFLDALKSVGMDIKSAKPGELTRKDVIEHLEHIDQHHYSSLLQKREGINELLSEVVRDIFDRKLREEGGGKVLPVLKVILCGVPRSGKTSFWKNLVNIEQTHDQPSLSTPLAESHSINVKIDHATIINWNLCDGGKYNEAISEIYRKILLNHPTVQLIDEASRELNSSEASLYQTNETSLQQTSEELTTEMFRDQTSEISPGQSNEKSHRQTSDHSHSTDGSDKELTQSTEKSTISDSDHNSSSTDSAKKLSEPQAGTQPSVEESETIHKRIDSILVKLREHPQVEYDNSKLGTVKLMINLIDTGGQSAFLQLLPLLTVGNAFYLIFFSYKMSIDELCQDEFEGQGGTIKLPHKFTQINIILQALRCVSTNLCDKRSSPNMSQCHVKALIVGTHKDLCCDKDVKRARDNLIRSKVTPFLDSKVLEYKDETRDHLVFRVNNDNKEEFSDHRTRLDEIIDKHFQSQEHMALPGSWLLFSFILREVKEDFLSFKDCTYIGDKLHMDVSEIRLALLHMRDNIGNVIYFEDVLPLKDIVICNPSVVFTSISEMILKRFYDKLMISASDHLRFRKYGIFTYSTFIKSRHVELDIKMLEHEKLVILLQHIGAIAPIKCSEASDTFECTLKNCDHTEPMYCIYTEYILPCVLPDAEPGELAAIEANYTSINCTPLMIVFEGEYAPVGGFCYLFTKLTSSQNWYPCLPPLHANDYDVPLEQRIYRNKITFVVDGTVYVTLLSTEYYYKIFVEECKGGACHECKIFHQVYKAISDTLSRCRNKAIKKYKPAFECTCKISESKHYMVVNESNLPNQLTTKCRKSEADIIDDKKDLYPEYSAWFREWVLVRKPKEKQSCLLGDEVRVFLCPTHQDDNYSYAWKCEVPNPKSSCEECALSTRTLTFKSFSEEDEDTYTCTVKYRDTFTETVSIKLVQKDVFVEHPRAGGIKYCTTTAQLSVQVDPEVQDKATYQWYRYRDQKKENVKDNDKDTSGAKRPQLTVRNLKEIHAGEYCCEVTIGKVDICSEKAKLEVKDLFERQPDSLDRCCYTTAHFEVKVDAREQIYKYCWHKDGKECNTKDFIGANSPRLSIKSLRKEHEGEYHCVVTFGNSCDSAQSKKAKLNVKRNCSLFYRVMVLMLITIVIIMILFAVNNYYIRATSSGLIMSYSTSHHEIELGNSLYLWCNASGAQSESVHWQWFHNGTQLVNGDGGVKINEDAGHTEIQVANTTCDSGGTYTCTVTSDQSSNDTSFIVQIIVPPAPVTNSRIVNVDSPEWENGFSDSTSILPDKMMVSSKGDKGDADNGSPTFFPHMNEAPTMQQLDYMYNRKNGKPLKIIERIGADYSAVGTSLLDDEHGEILRTIEHDKNGKAGDVVREIFRRWRKSSKGPVSWKVLVSTLKKADFITLANEIVDALSTLT